MRTTPACLSVAMICSRNLIGRRLRFASVVSAIASVLDHNNILINDFEFSHHNEKKRSMFLIRVGKKGVPDEVVEKLRSQEHITLVRKIQL